MESNLSIKDPNTQYLSLIEAPAVGAILLFIEWPIFKKEVRALKKAQKVNKGEKNLGVVHY